MGKRTQLAKEKFAKRNDSIIFSLILTFSYPKYLRSHISATVYNPNLQTLCLKETNTANVRVGKKECEKIVCNVKHLMSYSYFSVSVIVVQAVQHTVKTVRI